jgi:hypothetical protein
MSTTEQRRTEADKAKREAAVMALAYSSEFVGDWERFSSIVAWMEDAVTAQIARANDDEVSTWIPQVFAANVFWLRERLDENAQKLRKALEEAGMACPPLYETRMHGIWRFAPIV